MRLRTIAPGLTVVAATVIAPGICAAASAETHAARTVLTVYWGAESFPGTERMDAAVQSELRTYADGPVNYFAEYLETEEFPQEVASAALRDYIRRKYEGRHIDVVIAVASAALQFVLQYREELFPGVPIVFLTVALPQAVSDGTAARVTGVLNDAAFGETLALALQLQPSVKRVFVIARAPSVEGYDERVQSTLRRFSNRVELTYLNERTVAALLAAVRAVPPESLILYLRYTPDEPTPNLYPDEIARRIAEVSAVPIYTVSDLYVGSGVVGGMMRTEEATGASLAQIARRVLDGTPPERIPIAAVPTAPVFDWRQVVRWKLDVAKLPQGSHILFRTPTAWETYRSYILGMIVIVTAQLLLITALLTQRARRQRAERIVRAREASLRTSYDRIRQLAGRLINAQEVARANLAQDLHDDICQRLAMLSTAIDRLKTSSGDIQDAKTQRFLATLARDAHGTFDVVRALSHDLHPATLRVLGLLPAIKTHCSEVAKRHNVHVIFTAEGHFSYVPDEVAVCFFRIAQEALRNGVEHGEAKRLTVSLIRSDDDLEMTVTDDGRGFNPDAVSRDGSGVGVVSMEERARAIGGTLGIVSSGHSGTAIRLKAPINPSRPASAAGVSAAPDTMPVAARSPVAS